MTIVQALAIVGAVAVWTYWPRTFDTYGRPRVALQFV